ncbi:hypothetical protein [Moorena producens]|nr:hypothetical protein [Moorena producens]
MAIRVAWPKAKAKACATLFPDPLFPVPYSLLPAPCSLFPDPLFPVP